MSPLRILLSSFGCLLWICIHLFNLPKDSRYALDALQKDSQALRAIGAFKHSGNKARNFSALELAFLRAFLILKRKLEKV
jgi:hypothetical protein